MRARVLRIGFDRAHEGVARVEKALQLDEHEPHAVPRRRRCGLIRQDLAIRLERQLEAPQMREQQREIEPGGGKCR